MKIESALNAPYDTGKLMLTNDTYSIINLYKTTFPHNVILGWYYIGEEPDQHIKSMFETINENSTSKMVLHLDRVSLSQGIIHHDHWRLYSLEEALVWKQVTFQIDTSNHLISACLGEMALVPTANPEERK
jgi:hypothetical protein